MLSKLAPGFVLTDAQRQRLHSPTGLDVGAEQPEEIALAILGEVLATVSARERAPLRQRTGLIHPPRGVLRRWLPSPEGGPHPAAFTVSDVEGRAPRRDV